MSVRSAPSKSEGSNVPKTSVSMTRSGNRKFSSASKKRIPDRSITTDCSVCLNGSSTSAVKSSGSNDDPFKQTRSEEHTSELQSRVDLVCRLLLEQKNTSSEQG